MGAEGEDGMDVQGQGLVTVGMPEMTPETVSDAPTVPDPLRDTDGDGETVERDEKGRWKGDGARQAALLREAARRERRATDKILDALRKKAMQGDVLAAREYRAWLDREDAKGEGEEETKLEREARERVLDALVALTTEDRKGSGEGSDDPDSPDLPP